MTNSPDWRTSNCEPRQGLGLGRQDVVAARDRPLGLPAVAGAQHVRPGNGDNHEQSRVEEHEASL